MTTVLIQKRNALAILAIFSGLIANPVHADDFTPGALVKDVGLYFTSPVRWDKDDWTLFAGSIATIVASHQFDDDVRHHFTVDAKLPLDTSDPHSTSDWAPAAAIVAGTWVYATLLRDRAGFEEGGSMLEAAGLSAVSGYIFKSIARRERPNETSNINDWFAHGDSFPSSHTTVAFAVGTVLAESGSDSYRWVRRILGYGAAGATAYLRMKHNEHWLSDNVAGAFLGFGTGNFVLRRHGYSTPLSSLTIAPMNNGVMLAYSVTLR